MSITNNALSALNSFGTGWMAIANNVANVNTDGYKAIDVRYQDVANAQGVEVSEIRRDPSPGVPLEGRGDYVNEVSQAAAQAAQAEAAAQAAADARAAEYREASNVQIEREFTQAIAHEYAYAANAQVVRTYDDMMGTVIDMTV